MKFISIFIIIIGILCSCIKTKPVANSPEENSRDLGSSLFNYSDTNEYQKYRRFDFYTMKGYGYATDTPFVAVKSDINTVIAKVSNNITPYVFEREDGYWHMRRFYNFDNLDWSPNTLTMKDPKIIDFWIKNDTVYMLIQNFGGNGFGQSLMIDTKISEHRLFIGTDSLAIPYYDGLLNETITRTKLKYGCDFKSKLNDSTWLKNNQIRFYNRIIKGDSTIYGDNGHLLNVNDNPITHFNDDYCRRI